MKLIETQPPYSILSRFYDQVTRGSAGMSGHARRKVLGRILHKARVVCDLGCGTGTTAVELARSGKKVYAVDASPGQCKQARAKAREAKADVRVIRADMRKFKLPEPVDLVLCEFNPLNHLGRKQDIHLAFRSVARALKPGGWFYFDLNMFPTYKAYYPIVRWEERDEFCLVSRGAIVERNAKAWLELNWFVAERGGWNRYRERIEDTWWTDAEIRGALRAAGFVNVRAWDGTQIRPKKLKPRRGFDRYYLARKA
jgi:SAM-dependent methyltransferase